MAERNFKNYSLQKYTGTGSRHLCPKCNDKKSLTLYVDDSGHPIASTVGRCNHISGCGYHVTPKQYFESNGVALPKYEKRTFVPPPPKPKPTFHDLAEIRPLMAGYGQNRFVQFLLSRFDESTVSDLIRKFRIGTDSTRWTGATVFLQIDEKQHIRAGKVIGYDAQTGKRIKQPTPQISWLHSLMKKEGFVLSQCLFGLHQISNDSNYPICIVESEKSAVICSAVWPDKLWLATGGKQNLNSTLFEPLKGRDITLFPDVDGTDEWRAKAKTLGVKVKVSDYLSKVATPEQSHFDLADYLLQTDLKAICATQSESDTNIPPKAKETQEQPQDEPQPQPQPPTAPKPTKTLLDVGNEVLGLQNNMQKDEIINSLMTEYKICAERAEVAFTKLESEGVIIPTSLNDRFFLNTINNTPF